MLYALKVVGNFRLAISVQVMDRLHEFLFHLLRNCLRIILVQINTGSVFLVFEWGRLSYRLNAPLCMVTLCVSHC